MPESPPSPSRRRWMESAALLTVGSAFSAKAISNLPWPNPSKVTVVQTPPPPTPAEQLVIDTPPPAAPARPTGPPTYEDFIASFALRHIRPHELINPHRQTTRGIENTLPPQHLWSKMPASLFVADEIRERLGRPLNLITSAYRSPAYNKACGGASKSWHTQNTALDLVYEGGPKEAYAIACQLRDEGFFRGGIGLYRTFIHIDTRGKNATWRG
ncbi:YcbK family protein [Roseibacillus persicicus]|uniref:YcbK family protein n=1 Tax=Roseibacillus persicicus TaxID=454148 RepID=UPI00280FF2CE|nr:D-Ala-D-Ala carboxypeptidase family metallohydrolase [Roseibacillus persicicus]MDQ8191704.1 D-Ala-D-Ala carboxypeptidase family metallohydrolase [Roseibacillus persicicus]